MAVDYSNTWMKLQGYNMNRQGDYEYILWRNIDADGKYYYQITKGQIPSKDDGGYYDKSALLKLKGIV